MFSIDCGVTRSWKGGQAFVEDWFECLSCEYPFHQINLSCGFTLNYQADLRLWYSWTVSKRKRWSNFMSARDLSTQYFSNMWIPRHGCFKDSVATLLANTVPHVLCLMIFVGGLEKFLTSIQGYLMGSSINTTITGGMVTKKAFLYFIYTCRILFLDFLYVLRSYKMKRNKMKGKCYIITCKNTCFA